MDLIVLTCTFAAIVVGLAGAFVYRLPGMSLIWVAVLVWASIENTGAAWTVLGIATALAVANYVVQHLFAGHRLDEVVAPMRSVAIAAGLGAAGFLAARALGLLAGFAAGLYLTERRRLRVPGSTGPRQAQRSAMSRESFTELAAGLLVTTAWLVAVLG
ncbi:MAG TPA: DUF456 domain-containing protein [Jiangellales bacterium]|nr:DUF456 domain-containing protein [Jiangellales bacterium]